MGSQLIAVTMAFKFVITAFCLVGVQCMPTYGAPSGTDIEDFEEEHHGYKYIYHDSKDLLLTVHDNDCFFIKADDNNDHSDRFLNDEKPLGYFPSPRYAVEAFIRKIIRETGRRKIHASSVAEVLREFHDLVAKSECRRKNIFRVDFNWDELAKN